MFHVYGVNATPQRFVTLLKERNRRRHEHDARRPGRLLRAQTGTGCAGAGLAIFLA